MIDKKNLVCEVYKASKKTLDSGMMQVAEALKIYKQCKATGVWTNDVQAPVVVKSEYEILEV